MPAPLSILAEDDALIAVDKPPGLLTVDAPGRQGRTLLHLVDAALAAGRAGARALPVHRLDEETSGVLVFAKTPAARTALEAQFRAHDVLRLYHAVTAAHPDPPAGRIRSLLAEDRAGVVRSRLHGPGREAVTDYRTVALAGPYALVECEPATGRRNQIRVHLSERGWPLAGDRKYGVFRGRTRDLSRRAPRTLLHASALVLRHPADGSRLVLVSPLPRDFADLVGEEAVRAAEARLRERLP